MFSIIRRYPRTLKQLWSRRNRVKDFLTHFKQLKLTEGAVQNKLVVIINYRASLFYYLFNYTIANYLALEGIRVIILNDRKTLFHCDDSLDPALLKEDPAKGLSFISSLRRLIFHTVIRSCKFRETNRIKFTWLEDWLDSESLKQIRQEISSQVDSTLNPHVDGSHRRFFGGTRYNFQDPSHIKFAKINNFHRLVLALVVKRIMEKKRPDGWLLIDGIYATGGTVRQTLKELKQSYLLYQPCGFKERGLIIGTVPPGISGNEAGWHNFAKDFLTSSIKMQGESFLKKRVSSGLQPYSEDEISFVMKIRAMKQKYGRVVGLFPNLAWDVAIEERNSIFKDLQDWMIKTVEWSARQQIGLVIREHPQKRDVYSPRHSAFALLEIIDPNIWETPTILKIRGVDLLNSYKLIFNELDCSTCYNGTLILETAYLQRPMIIGANSSYNFKGISFEPSTQQEYFDLLSSTSKESSSFKEKEKSFKENAIIDAAFQISYMSHYFPLLPMLEEYTGIGDRYWRTWDKDESSLDPRQNMALRNTIDRLTMVVNTN